MCSRSALSSTFFLSLLAPSKILIPVPTAPTCFHPERRSNFATMCTFYRFCRIIYFSFSGYFLLFSSPRPATVRKIPLFSSISSLLLLAASRTSTAYILGRSLENLQTDSPASVHTGRRYSHDDRVYTHDTNCSSDFAI